MGQLGEVSRIGVGDVTFLVRMTWGKLRQITKALNQPATEDSAAGMFDTLTQALQETIIGVEGVTDAAGEPIEVAWQPEMVDDLSPEQVQALFRGLTNIGGEPRAGDPLADGTPPPSD